MIDELLTAIEKAHLTPILYRTAVRIAAHANSNGVTRLDWQTMLEIAETTNKETARGQLDRLIAAKLFTCKRNHSVLVVWELDSPANLRDSRNLYANRVDDQRGEQPANLRESRKDSAKQGEDSANRVGLLASPLGKDLTTGQVGKEGSPNLPDLEGVQGEPQPPQPAAAPIPAAEQARSVALLTDPEVGISGKLLAELPPLYPFAQIRLQVFRALRDLAAGDVKGLGVIKHRLRYNAPATATDADRDSDLWARHETEQERRDERERKYSLDGLTSRERFDKYAGDYADELNFDDGYFDHVGSWHEYPAAEDA